MTPHLGKRLLFWLLLPLTGVQGLLLKRKALRLPEPEGARQGQYGQGPELHLLAMGDSIIAGIGATHSDETLPVQFAQQFARMTQRRVHWTVDGRNGANLADLLLRINALPAATPADIILLSIGVNDVTGLSSTNRWRSQLQVLLKLIRSRWPKADVIFTGLPPMHKFPLPPQPLRFSLGLRAHVFDQIAEQVLSRQERMLHVATTIDPQQHGFCSDGFHPSADSYAIWGRELAALVAKKVLQRDL